MEREEAQEVQEAVETDAGTSMYEVDDLLKNVPTLQQRKNMFGRQVNKVLREHRIKKDKLSDDLRRAVHLKACQESKRGTHMYVDSSVLCYEAH